MENIPIFYLAIGGLLALFILGREVLCWYWKVNKSIENQELIIALLRQLVENSNKDKNQTKE